MCRAEYGDLDLDLGGAQHDLVGTRWRRSE